MNPNELRELKWWLKANSVTLRKYEPWDLAQMAHTCGFSWETIYQEIPEAYQDFQTRTTGKIRENWFVNRETDHIEARAGKPKLLDQWRKLAMYEHGVDWK